MSGSRAKSSSLNQAFSELKSDYDAGKSSRFIRKRTGLPSGGASADYHFRSEAEYYRLIEQARDYDRNDALCGQTIDRVVANVVQGGFTLMPETGDAKLDLDLWWRWKQFSEDPDECDIAGEATFHDYETMALRASLLDGDCVITGTADGPFQFFEAHEIATATTLGNTFCGVQIDDVRKRKTYYIGPDKKTNSRSNMKETAKPVKVRDENGVRQLFHVCDPRRMSQTRGVTTLMPIFAVMGILEDINFAKLVQQQIVSCFTIFRERSADPGATLPHSEAGYGESSVEATESGTRYIEGIQPGMEIAGQPGEKLQGFSPNTPNSEFFQHFRQQVSLIGATFSLSPAQVLLDFSMENFVGYRGALHEARKGMKAKQRMLVTRFHRPAYIWKVHQWISEDSKLQRWAMKKNVHILRHKWQPPSFEYLEPINDAAGDLLRVRGNLTSRRRLAAERGHDWEEIAEESVLDNAHAILFAKLKAAEINQKYPEDAHPVSWRDLISLPTADGIQVSMQSSSGGESKATARAQPAEAASE